MTATEYGLDFGGGDVRFPTSDGLVYTGVDWEEATVDNLRHALRQQLKRGDVTIVKRSYEVEVVSIPADPLPTVVGSLIRGSEGLYVLTADEKTPWVRIDEGKAANGPLTDVTVIFDASEALGAPPEHEGEDG